MTPLEDLRRVLEEMPHVRLAVLFGSAPKGAVGRDSDIDIGISLDGGVDSLAA